MMRMLLTAVTVIAVAGPGLFGRAAELPPPVDRKIDFTRDVKPLFSKHCWSCHGDKKQESGLRLDSRAALLKGGDLGVAVTTGKSADSRLIQFVAAVDPKNVMPPDGEGDRLSAEAVGILRAWIDQGCVWPETDSPVGAKNTHWAYQPLKRVIPPAVMRADGIANPIDRFVLAELEKRRLSPSPTADPTALGCGATALAPSTAATAELPTGATYPSSLCIAANVAIVSNPANGRAFVCVHTAAVLRPSRSKMPVIRVNAAPVSRAS